MGGLITVKPKIGDYRMRLWNVLVEANVQNVKFQGTITCHAFNKESAQKLACTTFINQLRRAGIWAHAEEVDEPYVVDEIGSKDKKTGKPTKKSVTKYKKVTRYHAPYWDHVKAIDILSPNARNLTFTPQELEEAAAEANGDRLFTKKKSRRTTDKVALDSRKKKMKSINKKEKAQAKKVKAATNKQNKDDLMKAVEAYFLGENAKIIKVAANELNLPYQRVRYALFQIKDKGYNNNTYKLIQTEIDGSKAFRLEK